MDDIINCKSTYLSHISNAHYTNRSKQESFSNNGVNGAYCDLFKLLITFLFMVRDITYRYLFFENVLNTLDQIRADKSTFSVCSKNIFYGISIRLTQLNVKSGVSSYLFLTTVIIILGTQTVLKQSLSVKTTFH